MTMKVRDLMTTDPLTVSPDTPLKEAARTMVRNKVSGLPVMVDAAVVGIVTEADFLRQEANRDQPYRFSLLDALFGEGPSDPPAVEAVAEVMTEQVITIVPEATIGEAARVMANKRVKRLPVVDDDGQLIGIVTEKNLIEQNKNLHIPTVISLFDAVIYLESGKKFEEEMKRLSATRVNDIFTPNAVTVSPGTSVPDIATLMAEKSIHTIPVVEGGKILGIIGKLDVIKGLAQG